LSGAVEAGKVGGEVRKGLWCGLPRCWRGGGFGRAWRGNLGMVEDSAVGEERGWRWRWEIGSDGYVKRKVNAESGETRPVYYNMIGRRVWRLECLVTPCG
jgi:hypothetical protein